MTQFNHLSHRVLFSFGVKLLLNWNIILVSCQQRWSPLSYDIRFSNPSYNYYTYPNYPNYYNANQNVQGSNLRPQTAVTAAPAMTTIPLSVPVTTCPSINPDLQQKGVQILCFESLSSAVSGQVGQNCRESQPISTVAKYSCLPNYQAAGQQKELFYICQENGKWLIPKDVLTCNSASNVFQFSNESFAVNEIRTCPPVPNLNNFQVDCFPNSASVFRQQRTNCKDRHRIGAIAVHTCGPKHEAVSLLQNMTWSCKVNGQWFIPDATLTCNDRKEKKITCPPITIEASYWQSKKVECFAKSPLFLGQSGVNCNETNHPIGTTAVHSCQPSYTAVSQLQNLVWTCDSNGKWNAPPGILTCKENMKCPPIDQKWDEMKIECFDNLSEAKSKNNALSCDSQSHSTGTTAKLSCKPFYKTTSYSREIFWTCLENGQWHIPESTLSCTDGSKTSFNNNHSVTVTCPPVNYESYQGAKIECFTNNLSRARCNETRNPVGTTARLSCMKSNDMSGSLQEIIWRCEENGKWNIPNEVLDCSEENNHGVTTNGIVITCPPINPRTKGMKLECISSISGITEGNCKKPQPVGTVAKYSCLPFYEAVGSFITINRKCRKNGRWTGSDDLFSCASECGKANQANIPFIAYGKSARIGQWPWHAALFSNRRDVHEFKYICGGTLIGKKTVLTAAHCVVDESSNDIILKPLASFRLYLGKHEREQTNDQVQLAGIERIVVHPSYNANDFDSDIAIIILKSEITVNYFVRPICFTQSSDSVLEQLQLSENSIGTVVGFGVTESGKLSHDLQMARLSVLSPRECSESLNSDQARGQIQIKSTTFCAGLRNGTNVCNGDSGSGMYFPSKNTAGVTKWYIQGLVSVGITKDGVHCDPFQVSIFTRVGKYANWIVNVVLENEMDE